MQPLVWVNPLLRVGLIGFSVRILKISMTIKTLNNPLLLLALVAAIMPMLLFNPMEKAERTSDSTLNEQDVKSSNAVKLQETIIDV